jgi:hypothetical protein
MGSPRLSTPRLHVVMADGSEHDVQALNVDLVAWDRDRAKHKWPLPADAPFVWLNYLAWHVLTREGITPDMTLRAFESAAVEVSSAAADELEDGAEDAGAVDPTNTDPAPA